MINTDKNYGILINSNIKLHRTWFKEMTKLIGINVIYRAPKPNKHYTNYAEVEANYEKPQLVGCIFDEHPEQQTLKKLGWASELTESAPIIHVPYDLEGLQQGALFIVPSGLDNASGRLFRVIKLSNRMVYPASITCQIVPEFETTYDKAQSQFDHNSFTLLNEEEDVTSESIKGNRIIFNSEDNQ